MDENAIKKRNLIMFPLGTVGRDMIYNLVTSYLLTFVLFTHRLTAAQVSAITAIMVAARVFDALNDPVMGNIIERTRTRWGKFKPWLVIGILTTSVVIWAAFNVRLQGWSFVAFFGVIYFLYSITYTMHDIAYWGMVPALSSDADTRNQYTSRATLFAGIGGVLAASLIPMLTAGSNAIGGDAVTALLMIFYPAISRKVPRKKFMLMLLKISIAGYILMSIAGVAMKAGSVMLGGMDLKFLLVTIGYMVANFGQYGYYLILMISIINTVEYNEYIHGTRDESIITSMRPFLTKMASALTVVITSVTYMAIGVTKYTKEISDLENQAAASLITEADKLSKIHDLLQNVTHGQALGLLLVMIVLPLALMALSYVLYVRHYTLDEPEYDRICAELKARREAKQA